MEDIFKNIENEKLRRRLFFISEIDKMKQIMRKTLLIDGSRQENDAEHSWHLGVMAFILEEYTKEPFSMERVLKMVLIHDLVEIYAGDTFAFDKEANMQKEEREKAAADKLFTLLPEGQGEELRALWEEFDRMDTPDSKYAAALDRLQPFVHNLLTRAHMGSWKRKTSASVGTLRPSDGNTSGTKTLDGGADKPCRKKGLD